MAYFPRHVCIKNIFPTAVLISSDVKGHLCSVMVFTNLMKQNFQVERKNIPSFLNTHLLGIPVSNPSIES